MRVAALAPLAAMLVTIANAAPVPVADPFAFCFFGFGNGCDSAPTTTSVAAVKTTSSSVVASSVKVTSTSSMVASTSKAASSTAVSSVKSSSVASATSTKAATTTQSVANWTWLWDPTYVFNMWNNFLTFRWEKYNDCNFNGYSLNYVKAYYYNTYGFKPLTGCQWKDVYTFMDKYAVKNSIKPASNAIFTPGCANPFGGADANWKPTVNAAVSSAQVSSSSAKVSSSSPASSSGPASSSKASSSVAPSPVASSPAASSPAAPSPVVSSPVASSSAVQSLAAQSVAAQSPAVQSPAAQSPVAQSAAAQSPAASSSAVQSSVVVSSSATSPSAIDNSVPASATDSSSPSGSNSASGGNSATGTTTASASVVTPTSYGTPVTFSNGQTAQYLGCVAEIDGRKFTKASIDDSTVMTNEFCSNYCSNLGFPVAGTEYAKECYCATYDQIATYTVSDHADATGQSICGGPQALSVMVNPSAVRTVSLPTNWAAQGCFQDNNDRVLTYQAWSGNTATTVESCSAASSLASSTELNVTAVTPLLEVLSLSIPQNVTSSARNTFDDVGNPASGLDAAFNFISAAILSSSTVSRFLVASKSKGQSSKRFGTDSTGSFSDMTETTYSPSLTVSVALNITNPPGRNMNPDITLSTMQKDRDSVKDGESEAIRRMQGLTVTDRGQTGTGREINVQGMNTDFCNMLAFLTPQNL
ncbi:hypothetical protein QFC21_004073 [Naganishia friedmannii]|uniref:Uncharacterized protein n=1 Tax=Naganishia friedmannii TaxID=89922 RepID=A0ACC2VJ70_9TREE|nr:hypothetical protein QFC21_004073 [Naganishia friedmannii]